MREIASPLTLAVAAALESRVPELARQWWRSTRSGTDLGTAGQAAGRRHAEQLATSLLGVLREQPQWQETVMRAGWNYGCEAHRAGVPLHFVLEELDVLTAMLLACAMDASEPTGAGAAEGIGVARRLLSGVSMLRLAATKGYTHAVVNDLRHRYRQIRHGLRNPLGTIKTALALMDDESIPEETRRSGRFKAMAERNAKSLEGLIAQTLGDRTALLPAFAHEPVSLRTIACAVRRDLRAEAEARQLQIVVGDALPTVRIDSAGLELILKSAVLALMRETEAPAEIVIDLVSLDGRAAAVSVAVQPESALGRTVEAGELSFAGELATSSGGRLWVQDGRRLCVEVPVSELEQRNDLGRPRQRPDAEPRAL